LLTDFMRTSDPANVASGRWGELLRSGGGGESGRSSVSPAAVPLRGSAKRPAGRRSTG
jgi:hypothetical protein